MSDDGVLFYLFSILNRRCRSNDNSIE